MRSDIIHMNDIHMRRVALTQNKFVNFCVWWNEEHVLCLRQTQNMFLMTYETWGAAVEQAPHFFFVVWHIAHEKWHHSYATYTRDVGRRHRTCSSFIVVVWPMSYEKWHHSCATYSWDVGRWQNMFLISYWCGVAHVIWEAKSFIWMIHSRRGAQTQNVFLIYCYGVAHVIWEVTSFICDVHMRRGALTQNMFLISFLWCGSCHMRRDIIHMRRKYETWVVDTEHVPHLLLWCGPCHILTSFICDAHMRRGA